MGWKWVKGRLVFDDILSPVSASLPSVSGSVVGQGSVGTIASGGL